MEITINLQINSSPAGTFEIHWNNFTLAYLAMTISKVTNLTVQVIPELRWTRIAIAK